MKMLRASPWNTRRFGAAVLMAVLLAACSTGPAPSAPSAQPTAVSTGSLALPPVGCGATPANQAAPPAWTADANPPSQMQIVLSQEGSVAAFPFGAPLHVPPIVSGRTNKILWIVREPRNGQPLSLTGHPLGASVPAVSYSFPANGGPGEIYSTIVDVPSAGCWHFTLTWGANTGHIDMQYGSGA